MPRLNTWYPGEGHLAGLVGDDEGLSTPERLPADIIHAFREAPLASRSFLAAGPGVGAE